MSEQSPPKRRWVMPLLAVSLVVNMLIVGIVAGFFIANGPGKGDRLEGPARSLVGTPFIRALEPENRRALGREILRDETRLRENRSALRARFEALLAALKADPFDPDAVQSILREQRDIALRRQNIGEALLVDQLAKLSPEERAAYADRLARDLRRLRRE
ncbi:MAG: periplasmic heavy metal sensor [Boseongicola sp.]|nr:periplasmic heavy metal sensor [Boseongicola sp.]NNJ69110.1 periplasmic heavy metal sensor [Boseongicola sp.]